jgi:hypothetical protein
MAFEVLATSGLFDFKHASGVIDQFLAELHRSQNKSLRELLHLSAAEAALIPALVDPRPPQFPITVTEDAARLALLETDCVPWDWQHVVGGHARLWDAIFFAADVSKLALLQPKAQYEVSDPEQITGLIQQLEQRYRDNPSPRAKALASSGLLKVRGLLWQAKLSVLLRPQTATTYIRTLVSRVTAVQEG